VAGRVGVLALQGAFREHVAALRDVGVEAVEVRLPRDLEGLDGLVIPGGESSTMSKLIDAYDLEPPIRILAHSDPGCDDAAQRVPAGPAEVAHHRAQPGGPPALRRSFSRSTSFCLACSASLRAASRSFCVIAISTPRRFSRL